MIDHAEDHDAFLRWQEERRTQLGHVVNLVLTLTTATLGFAVMLVVDKRITSVSPGNRAFFWSVILLLVAIATGLLVEMSRLFDVRYTAQAARDRAASRTRTQMRSAELAYENRLASAGSRGVKQLSPRPHPLAGYALTTDGRFWGDH